MAGGAQRGEQRAGVGGLIRLSGNSAPFHGDTTFYSATTEAALKLRIGRGDTSLYARFRNTGIGSSVIIRYKFQSGGTPAPAEPIGTTGSITFQIDSGKTITVPIAVTGFGPNFNVDKDDAPYASMTARVTGPLVYAGWPADQPTPDTIVKTNQEQFAGTTKGADPHGLAPPMTQRLTDVWGSFANTDIAEWGIIQAFISGAQPPIAGYKLRDVQFSRDSFDGGTLIETWGLTDHKDDVQMPLTPTADDPYDIQDSAAITLVSNSANTPPAPAAPLGELIGIDRLQLNDGRWRFTWRFGNTNSKNSIEFEASPVDRDPLILVDADSQTIITASQNQPPTPTSRIVGLKLRRITSKRITGTPEQWEHTFAFARRNTQDDVEQDGGERTDDPNNLQSEAKITKVTNTDAAPAPPVLAGFTYRTVATKQLHDTRWAHTYSYGLRDTKADIEYPKSPKDTDVEHIDDEAKITRVTQNAQPPAAPPVPTGADNQPLGQLIETTTIRQDDGNYVHTFTYGNTTSFQKIAFPQARFNVDPADIDYHEEIPVRSTSFLAPAQPTPQNTALKFRARRGHRISGTPEQWLHIFEFDHNTTQDEIELRGTNKKNDPNDIDESAEITQVTGNANPPTTPAAPLGSLNEIVSQPLKAANGAYTGRWAHTWRYVSTTNLQKITNQGDIDNDIAALKSEDVQTLFSPTSTAPNPPNIRVPGTKIIRYVSRRIVGTPAGWQHQYFYGYWDEKDRIEAGGTWQKIDPNNIDSDVKITLVRATQPNDPPTPAGTKIISRDNKPLPNGFNEYSFIAANLDSLDKVTLPKFKTYIDPNAIDDSAVRYRVWFTNGSPPNAPLNPPTNNVKLIGSTDLTYSPAVGTSPGTNIRVWLYGAKDSADDLVIPKFRTSIDVSGLESSAIRAALDVSTPIVDPVLTAANLVYVTTHTQQVTLNLPNSNHTLFVFEYAMMSTKRKVEVERTRVTVSPLTLYKRRIATVIPVTGTIQAMADAILAANLSDKTFERAALQLLNDQQALKIIETTNEDQKPHSHSWHTELMSMRAIATGGFGLPACICHFIAPGTVTGALFTTGTVVPVEVYRTRGRFLYRRRYITSTPEAHDAPGTIGAVNAATFLGHAAHKIMYSGAIRQYCYGNTAASLLIQDFVMQYDSHLWVNFSTVPYGRVWTRAGAGGPPASGYVDPAIFDQNARAEWPPVNDFSIFTA